MSVRSAGLQACLSDLPLALALRERPACTTSERASGRSTILDAIDISSRFAPICDGMSLSRPSRSISCWRRFCDPAERCGFDITAYCFMPDHVHLLVQGLSDHADLKEFVKRSKQTSGFRYKQATNRPLRQPSYYDHALRDDETSVWTIAYILRNPIVAGLVERCEDYPFLGSGSGTLAELMATLQEGLGADWETRDLVPVGGMSAHEAGLPGQLPAPDNLPAIPRHLHAEEVHERLHPGSSGGGNGSVRGVDALMFIRSTWTRSTCGSLQPPSAHARTRS